MDRTKILGYMIEHYSDASYNNVLQAFHTLYKAGLLDQDTWDYIDEIDEILFRVK